MKKTLILLAVGALITGTTLSAAETDTPQTIFVRGETQSNVIGAALARGATLINTETGDFIVYDENETTIPPIEAPFDVEHGVRVKNYTLEGTLPTAGEKLILDFTALSSTYVANWGYYLTEDATVSDGQTEFEVDYLVFNFKDTDLASWYSKNPMSITGIFTGGIEATGYIISKTCDQTDPDTSYGGIVFFNQKTAPALTPTANVPEPTTTTLSLLALVGLFSRRRRK